ncbi:MAG: class I SAM-dependent methyltransferase [Clostridia bacterium]|nr:class I SAM-dependent methyltransferase [Clostridia bacterium]
MKSLLYNKKFFRNPLIRRLIHLSILLTQAIDAWKDRRICGCSLVKYVPSKYRESHGATGSRSTSYWALDQVIGDDDFSATDAFIDVGCGKGRVLAYMIGRGFPCALTGVELNPEVAAFAEAWAKEYDQITILNGDAFALDYNDFTVLFLGRPFEKETSERFIDQLEKKLTHAIRLYYWWDLKDSGYLENRAGWRMLRRGWVFNKRCFFMYSWPQRYTVWEYTPD